MQETRTWISSKSSLTQSYSTTLPDFIMWKLLMSSFKLWPLESNVSMFDCDGVLVSLTEIQFNCNCKITIKVSLIILTC